MLRTRRRSPMKRVLLLLLFAAFAITLVGCASSTSETVSGNMTVRFLDVGQGDSILITLPGGETMLIDAGPGAVKDRVVQYLKNAGVSRIDYLIFTHPHEDHIGGAVAVLEAFDVGQVWMPRTSHTTQTYEELLLALESKELKVDEAKAGKTIIEKGNMKVWCLSPAKAYDNLNNWSAVLALAYDEVTFLFEGDAEKEAEEAMTLSSSVQLPDADVLKVAHHGSSSSTTQAFLELVSPEIAIISVGAGNSYGHPAQTTLDRLAAAGAKVFRTDKHGTITVTTDGTTLEVATERQ